MATNAAELVNESVERWWKAMEQIRVINAQKMWYWYQNDKSNIDLMIKESMKKMFSPKTMRKMNVRVFNIVPRVIDKLGLVYKYPPQRMLEGGITYETDKTTKKSTPKQSEDDKRYQEIMQASTIGMKQGQWQKQAKLFNTVLVQPVWMKDDDRSYMDYRIYSPAWTIVTPRKDNYLKIESLYYPIWKEVKGVIQQVLVYWSDTEHFDVDRNGNKIAPPDNPEMKNPYGKLPFAVLRMKEGIDFWGDGMWDLIDGSEEVCIQLTNLYYVSIFQAHGQAVAINLNLKGNPQTGPDTPIVSNNAKAGDIPPSFEFKNPNPNLKAVQDLIDWTVKTVQTLRGLGPQQFAIEQKALASGVSKVIDSVEIEEIREDDSTILLLFESDLHEKTVMVYNYENSGKKINPKAKFSIKFGEKQVVKDGKTQQEERQSKLNMGTASRIDFILEDNPGMTREEAEQKLQDIQAENERFKDGFSMFDKNLMPVDTLLAGETKL
jgi:hypothetical protein